MNRDDAIWREQLQEARVQIVRQLDEIEVRIFTPGIARRGGPPDYGPMVAALEHQLREIEDILGPGGAEQN